MVQASLASQPLTSRPVLATVAAVVALLAVATLALWAHYGSAVFYEMILSGLAACG